MNKEIAQLRKDYALGELEIKDVLADPVQQFEKWIKEAINAEILEPNAMILSTVDEKQQPSARVVLLKGLRTNGFIFYTNYESDKARQMEVNPKAALTFNWLELQRQVRIEGMIEKLDEDTSTEYFQSRPRGSQIGAWASPQSRVISDRRVLEDAIQQLEEEYKGFEKLPKPSHWGGYILTPSKIEFWQGRSSRLHDRILFNKVGDNDWTVERLAP